MKIDLNINSERMDLLLKQCKAKIKKRVTKEGFLVDGTQERKRNSQLSFV